MEKTLEELKFLISKRKEELIGEQFNVLAVGLSAKRNLCIHDIISKEATKEKVDSGCKRLIADWNRVKYQQFKTDSAKLPDLEDIDKT